VYFFAQSASVAQLGLQAPATASHA
jgi:hypothetical protein